MRQYVPISVSTPIDRNLYTPPPPPKISPQEIRPFLFGANQKNATPFPIYLPFLFPWHFQRQCSRFPGERHHESSSSQQILKLSPRAAGPGRLFYCLVETDCETTYEKHICRYVPFFGTVHPFRPENMLSPKF